MKSTIGILIILGTRPEAIKLAPLINILKSDTDFNVKVCVTGQHKELVDSVLTIFKIRPDYNLNLDNSNSRLAGFAGRMLHVLDNKLNGFNPNFIIVHGDTTTTLVGALYGFYNNIKVCHIEAGLRTLNLREPWPEEGNRQLVSRISTLHFAPTENARQNLISENIAKKNIYVTGNTGIDSLVQIVSKLQSNTTLNLSLAEKFDFLDKNKRIILVTGHRRENFGEGLASICETLIRLSSEESVQIVYTLHPNPNVHDPVRSMLGSRPNIHLLEHLKYIDFLYLMNLSYLILTDSGGIQEEGPSLGKPILVTRNTTERPEAVFAGTTMLVGTNPEIIYSNVMNLLSNKDAYQTMSRSHNPYGDGKASEYIHHNLKKYISETTT